MPMMSEPIYCDRCYHQMTHTEEVNVLKQMAGYDSGIIKHIYYLCDECMIGFDDLFINDVKEDYELSMRQMS